MALLSDAMALLGDAMALLGDAMALLLLGDAMALLGDAMALLGDTMILLKVELKLHVNTNAKLQERTFAKKQLSQYLNKPINFKNVC